MKLFKRMKNLNESGALSVEFMVVMAAYSITIVGLFSFIEAYLASTRAYKANAMVANLVSRHTMMDSFTFDQANIVYQRMTKSDALTSSVRMTLMRYVNGEPQIQWSVTSEGKEHCIPHDHGLIEARMPEFPDGTEVIMLETSTQHRSIFKQSPIGPVTMTQDVLFYPRFTAQFIADTKDNPPDHLCNYDNGVYNPEGGDDDLGSEVPEEV